MGSLISLSRRVPVAQWRSAALYASFQKLGFVIRWTRHVSGRVAGIGAEHLLERPPYANRSMRSSLTVLDERVGHAGGMAKIPRGFLLEGVCELMRAVPNRAVRKKQKQTTNLIRK